MYPAAGNMALELYYTFGVDELKAEMMAGKYDQLRTYEYGFMSGRYDSLNPHMGVHTLIYPFEVLLYSYY